ncbi:MAG: hypothetical protein QOH30_2395 [Baekduia sp.]|jgi:hypothetical protein|nr:hypothetical protein [Conexibacter sp.]MDX6715837.1 hypothetical protein [Baekduia sp.]
MEDDRKPDHTDDPREQDTGSGGYPESNPAATQDDDAEGGADRSGGDTSSGAPSPSTDKEADRGASTGNPGAAG